MPKATTFALRGSLVALIGVTIAVQKQETYAEQTEDLSRVGYRYTWPSDEGFPFASSFEGQYHASFSSFEGVSDTLDCATNCKKIGAVAGIYGHVESYAKCTCYHVVECLAQDTFLRRGASVFSSVPRPEKCDVSFCDIFGDDEPILCRTKRRMEKGDSTLSPPTTNIANVNIYNEPRTGHPATRPTEQTEQKLATDTMELTTVPAQQLKTEVVQKLETDEAEDTESEASHNIATEVAEPLTAIAEEELATEAAQQLTTSVDETLSTDAVEEAATGVVQQNATEAVEKMETDELEELATEATQQLAPFDELATESAKEPATEAAQKLTTEVVEKLETNQSEELTTEAAQQLATEMVEKGTTDAGKELATEAAQLITTDVTKELISKGSAVPDTEKLTTVVGEELASKEAEEPVTVAAQQLSTGAEVEVAPEGGKILLTLAPEKDIQATEAAQQSTTIIKVSDHLNFNVGTTAPSKEETYPSVSAADGSNQSTLPPTASDVPSLRTLPKVEQQSLSSTSTAPETRTVTPLLHIERTVSSPPTSIVETVDSSGFVMSATLPPLGDMLATLSEASVTMPPSTGSTEGKTHTISYTSTVAPLSTVFHTMEDEKKMELLDVVDGSIRGIGQSAVTTTILPVNVSSPSSSLPPFIMKGVEAATTKPASPDAATTLDGVFVQQRDVVGSGDDGQYSVEMFSREINIDPFTLSIAMDFPIEQLESDSSPSTNNLREQVDERLRLYVSSHLKSWFEEHFKDLSSSSMFNFESAAVEVDLELISDENDDDEHYYPSSQEKKKGKGKGGGKKSRMKEEYVFVRVVVHRKFRGKLVLSATGFNGGGDMDLWEKEVMSNKDALLKDAFTMGGGGADMLQRLVDGENDLEEDLGVLSYATSIKYVVTNMEEMNEDDSTSDEDDVDLTDEGVVGEEEELEMPHSIIINRTEEVAPFMLDFVMEIPAAFTDRVGMNKQNLRKEVNKRLIAYTSSHLENFFWSQWTKTLITGSNYEKDGAKVELTILKTKKEKNGKGNGNGRRTRGLKSRQRQRRTSIEDSTAFRFVQSRTFQGQVAVFVDTAGFDDEASFAASVEDTLSNVNAVTKAAFEGDAALDFLKLVVDGDNNIGDTAGVLAYTTSVNVTAASETLFIVQTASSSEDEHFEDTPEKRNESEDTPTRFGGSRFESQPQGVVGQEMQEDSSENGSGGRVAIVVFALFLPFACGIVVGGLLFLMYRRRVKKDADAAKEENDESNEDNEEALEVTVGGDVSRTMS